jgi:hypothetical protein
MRKACGRILGGAALPVNRLRKGEDLRLAESAPAYWTNSKSLATKNPRSRSHHVGPRRQP